MIRDEASKMMIVVGSLLFYVWVVLRDTSGPFWNHSEVDTLHQLQNRDLEHLTSFLYYEIREITLEWALLIGRISRTRGFTNVLIVNYAQLIVNLQIMELRYVECNLNVTEHIGMPVFLNS